MSNPEVKANLHVYFYDDGQKLSGDVPLKGMSYADGFMKRWYMSGYALIGNLYVPWHNLINARLTSIHDQDEERSGPDAHQPA